MKHHGFPVLLLCCLTLLSCTGEKAEDTQRSLVFSGTVLEEYDVPAEIREFPAAHGGKITGVQPLENGGILQCETVADGRVMSGFFCDVMGADGTHLLTLTPADDLGQELSAYNIAAGDMFTVTDALAAEDGYVIASSAGLCSYDSAGSLKWKAPYQNCMDVILHEDWLLLYCGGMDEALYRVDPADGTREKIETEGDMQKVFGTVGGGDILIAGKDGLLYTANDTGLYRIALKEKRKTVSAQITQIAEWISSGILPSEISALTVENGETMVLCLEKPDGEAVMRYTMLPPDQVLETDYMVLAVLNSVNDYHLPVFRFNEESDSTQVLVKDYTVYEEDQRYLLFNADMAAGNIPDMVIMWQHSNKGTTIAGYERSGIFADLTPLMKADADFNYDGLLNYVTVPYQWSGGEQYLFPIQPSIGMWFGSADLFDGPVTMEEYLDLCEEGGYAASGSFNLFESTMDDYYDEETAVCTFNDGTLAALMNRADGMKDNPEEMPREYRSLPYPTLFEYASRTMDLEDCTVPIGLPNGERELCTEDSYSEFFAVTKAGTRQEKTVEFLRYLLEQNTPGTEITYDFTDTVYPNMISPPFGYTYYREDISRQLESYAGRTLVISGHFVFMYDDDDPALAKADSVPLKLTKEHADAMTALLDGIVRRMNQGNPVHAIIWEELRNRENRPVETVLDMIQSRVSIYLAEKLD